MQLRSHGHIARDINERTVELLEKRQVSRYEDRNYCKGTGDEGKLSRRRRRRRYFSKFCQDGSPRAESCHVINERLDEDSEDLRSAPRRQYCIVSVARLL